MSAGAEILSLINIVEGCRFSTCRDSGICAAVEAALLGLSDSILHKNTDQLLPVIKPFERVNCPNVGEILQKLE